MPAHPFVWPRGCPIAFLWKRMAKALFCDGHHIGLNSAQIDFPSGKSGPLRAGRARRPQPCDFGLNFSLFSTSLRPEFFSWSRYLVFHILRSVYSSLCSRDLGSISRKLLPSGPQHLQFCFSLLSQV